MQGFAKFLYIDIETAPTDSPAARALLEKNAKAPANYKDPTKIADAKAADVEKKLEKSTLDSTLGEICVIQYALDDEDPVILIVNEFAGEYDLLAIFLERIGDRISDATVWVGFNHEKFDLPFLYARVVCLQLFHTVLSVMPFPRSLSRDQTLDLMTTWAGVYNRDQWPSMAKLCFALGVESPKEEMSGKDVAPALARGEVEAVRTYGEHEIRALRQCHNAMTFDGRLIIN